MNKTQKWSDEDELKLFEISKRLHTDKKPPSMSQIAGMFKDKSKNAIIGKLYRSGLSRNKISRRRRIKKVIKLYFSNTNIKSNKKIDYDGELFELFTEHTTELIKAGPKHCRWPIGGLHCCGDLIQQRSYCEKHFKISYGKPEKIIL